MYVCPACLRASHSTADETLGWCGACEGFTRDSPAQTRRIIARMRRSGDEVVADNAERRMAREGHPHVKGIDYDTLEAELESRRYAMAIRELGLER